MSKLILFTIYFLLLVKQHNDPVTSLQSIIPVVLEKQYSFPSIDSHPFLTDANQIVLDSQNNIFVMDRGESTIYKFSESGELAKQFGNKGRGPGEFLTPNRMTLDGDTLIIDDFTNSRIILFDTQGDFLKFRNQSQNYMFRNSSRGISFGQPLRRALFNEANHHLINMYGTNGEILVSFGEFVTYENSRDFKPSLVNLSEISIHSDKIFVMKKYFPMLIVYNFEGEFLASHSFSEMDYREKISRNYYRNTYEPITAATPDLLVQAINIHNESLFLGLYDQNNIIIDHFDLKGKFINRYIYHSDESLQMVDFAVDSRGTEPIFYVLTAGNHYSVHKFK